MQTGAGGSQRVEARPFRAELRAVLGLAGPIVVSQLGQVGMNTADTVMVGPLGARALAATGLGSAIHVFGLVTCMGIIVGMTPLVSQAFGAGDRRLCRRVLIQGVILALLLAIPESLLSWEGGPVARWLGQEPGVAALAGDYMRALTWGVVPYFVFSAFRQFLEGMGITKPTMIITFLGLVINIAGNRIFIYGLPGLVPALGVVGSGWATTLVRWAMLAAMLGYVLRRPDLHLFRDMRFRLQRRLFGRIARVGLPVGAQFGLEVGLFSFAAVMMGWLGPLQLAAHQVTINIAATTFMVALGASLAGSVRVGQQIGAGDGAGMRRAVLATYVMAVGFMAFCALLFLAMPRVLIRLYTPDAGIITLGSRLLLVAAAFQVFDGAQISGVGVLRGAAETRSPMLVAAVGYWLMGLPVGYLLAFPADWGPVGIWAGLSLGLATAALALGWRVRVVFWRTPLATLRVHD